MSVIAPQPGILDISPYQGGKAHLQGHADVVKLSSNENPFGPSPKAVAAAQATLAQMHVYPDGGHTDLRAAIGETFGLDPARIVCGAGSDEILSLLCQAYAGPGDEVLHTAHGFAMYRISTLAAGATPVAVAERDRTADIDALLAAAGPRTRLVFLANPNNPTGTMLPAAELARLADGLPNQALLVLDGAYAEFIEGWDGGAALAQSRENVVMTRTFSKLYGLGGMRVGWCLAPAAVVDVLHRVRQPFNLSQTQQEAAIAALGDRDHAAFSRAENAQLRDGLVADLTALGVPCDRSWGNFVLPRFADAAEAKACNAALEAAGLIVRQVAGYGLPHCLRISVGDAAACQRVVAAIAGFKDKAA